MHWSSHCECVWCVAVHECQEDGMDPIVAKLIQSRTKSIEVLESELSKLRELVKGSKVPSVAASIQSVVVVKEQRLQKLREELRGFRQLADAQLEVPGTSSAEPPAPGPVMGKGRPPGR